MCLVDLSDSIGNLPLELVDDLTSLDEADSGLISFLSFFFFQLGKIFADGFDADASKCLKQFLDPDGLK